MPPKSGRPMQLYLSTTDITIGSMVAQENAEGKEHVMYYYKDAKRCREAIHRH